ncbi:hypothetical protein BGY98DRAFT_989118, partial [Russula aff. rugulosa BPL654]
LSKQHTCCIRPKRVTASRRVCYFCCPYKCSNGVPGCSRRSPSKMKRTCFAEREILRSCFLGQI